MFKLHVISFPDLFEGEAEGIIDILAHEDVLFHLRKPKLSEQEYCAFLECIPTCFYSKIILHSAYHMAKQYQFAGLHFATHKRSLSTNVSDSVNTSTSCHALEELELLQDSFQMCFISPVYDSVSKKDYKANFDMDDLSDFIKNKKRTQVVALGGIGAKEIPDLQKMGFDGAAVLGHVWGDSPKKGDDFRRGIQAMCKSIARPYCLSIAGFDPSSGAGVSSDIKTFESLGCYGFGVSTALTFQNADEFMGLDWVSLASIKKQVQALLCYDIKFIKIGLIESFDILKELLLFLEAELPEAYIIWDPILKASAGFGFHTDKCLNDELLMAIDLMTPNAEEYEHLGLDGLKADTAILLKGGHRKTKYGIDTLYHKGQVYDVEGELILDKKDKHGTGCVLSSAILSYLARGEEVLSAVELGKRYVEKFILSSNGRLGTHAQRTD